MRDKRIPFIVAAFLCATLWAVGELTREPWPAPIFPSFGAITFGQELDRNERRIIVFTNAEGSMDLELSEVFNQANSAFHRPMTDTLINLEGDGSDALSQWANQRARDSLAWSTCVQSLELLAVAGSTGERQTLTKIDFPQCQ